MSPAPKSPQPIQLHGSLKMENGLQKWRTKGPGLTIRGLLTEVTSNLNPHDPRRLISLGLADPSAFPCFRTCPAAEDAVVHALRSASFNGYSSSGGILSARQAIADHLSRDLPYKLTSDDVCITVGCTQAIEVAVAALSRPGANILLPRPGYPNYEARAGLNNLETRFYDLIPEEEWEVDLDSVEALADANTVAIVIINPGNPSGSVYTCQHLQEVAETARKLGIVVVADEVYDQYAFGGNPFVPMGSFGSIAPVLTLGSISKRWLVPGWRLGWLVTSDPNGIFKKHGELTECIRGYVSNSVDPTTFIQGAIPELLANTKDEFFSRISEVLRKDVDICWKMLKEVACITCPNKPQGGMFVIARLNLCLLDGIKDDVDFCSKLAKEESVVILPGVAVGLKNWVRLSFAVEPDLLEEALQRVKEFCKRHTKEQ